MLHAACQVHFAFMRVARMACFMHEQLWLFYMHACMVLSFACMNMGACMLMPKLCSCCLPPCPMCGQKDVLHPPFSKVCRVSRKCHAFGISVRTTTRCLSHYRRLWHRKGWLHGKINFLSFGCRCVTYPFSMRTFFFQTWETNTKPKFEQKLCGTHFCVPNEGAGMCKYVQTL